MLVDEKKLQYLYYYFCNDYYCSDLPSSFIIVEGIHSMTSNARLTKLLHCK